MAKNDEFEVINALLNVGDTDLDIALKAHDKIKMIAARWQVAKIVLIVYATSILSIVFYLVIKGIFLGGDVFPDMIELVKIALLPIITLVFGYYYGVSQK